MKATKHQKKGGKMELKRAKTVGKNVSIKEKIGQKKELISLVDKHYSFKPDQIKQLKGGYQSKNYIVDYKGEKLILKLQGSKNLNELRDNLKFRTNILKELEHRIDEPRLDYPRVVQSPKGEVMFQQKTKQSYITMLRFIPGRNLSHQETYPLRNSLMNALGIFQTDLAKVGKLDKKKLKLKEWKPISDEILKEVTENIMGTIPTAKTNEKAPIKAPLKTHIKTPIKKPMTQKTTNKVLNNITNSNKPSQTLRDHKIYLDQFIESYVDFGRNHLKDIKLSISHCDLHNGNILTNKQGSKVTGIIDFGWSLSFQYFYEDFKYLFRSVICAIPSKKLKPSAALNDLCEMVYQYHRYCPLNFQSLEMECLYFVMGRYLLEFNRKNGQLRHSKVPVAYKNTLLLLFLKVPPKQFIANLKERCLNAQNHVEKKQSLPNPQQEKKEDKLMLKLQRIPLIKEYKQLNRGKKIEE